VPLSTAAARRRQMNWPRSAVATASVPDTAPPLRSLAFPSGKLGAGAGIGPPRRSRAMCVLPRNGRIAASKASGSEGSRRHFTRIYFCIGLA
jgi:hypothetical protein